MTDFVLRFVLVAFAVGALGMFAGTRRMEPARRRQRWIKFATYFAIVYGMLLACAAGWIVLTAVMALIAAAGARELHRSVAPPAAWVVYAALCAGSLAFALEAAPTQALFLYVIVAFFDGFSQICGQLFGRTPLVPRISPAKTVEGAMGGFVVTAFSGWYLASVANWRVPDAVAVSVILMLAGLAGDLAASWLKRRAGIKDFGTMLPGHGGALDRFDSLLAAAPLALFLLPTMQT